MENVSTADGRSLKEILKAHAQWVEGVDTAFRGILDGETLNGKQLQELFLH